MASFPWLRRLWDLCSILRMFDVKKGSKSFSSLQDDAQAARCLLLRQDRCLLLRQDRCLLLTQDRCLLVRQGAALSHQFTSVSAEDICPVSAADICPVSTADICPVLTEDIWLLWGHPGKIEIDFDPFFTPKMRKMAQIRWTTWSRRSHGNDAMGRSAEPRSTRAGG